MTNIVQERITQIAQEALRDCPIVIWYDEGGSLRDMMFEVSLAGVNFTAYSGSYLAIRNKIEKEDPDFQGRWLIYVPQEPMEASWIRDYELFGKKLVMNFERLLVDFFGLESDAELRALLDGERGRLLANRFGEVIRDPKSPILKSQIINALLSVAFNLGPGFSLGRSILEYATFSTPRQELTRLGLFGVFAKQIRSELNLDIEVKEQDYAETLASALLFSELVHFSKGLGEQKFGKLLPRKDRIEAWATLAREWLEHTSLRQGFISWSKELAKKYDLENELQGIDNLLDILSFSAVDEVLLDELKARISSSPEAFGKNLEIMERTAKAREKSPWTVKGKINIWKSIGDSAQLYRSCRDGISLLDGGLGDPQLLAGKYVDSEGWWKIDSIYRKLCMRCDQLDEEVSSIFLKPSFGIYSTWLRTFTERFSNVVGKLEEWKIDGLMSQFEFWTRIVERMDKPVAVFLIDALRFELGKELEFGLVEKGYSVEVIPMLSSLPSITEIGMASLLPHTSLAANVKDGKLEVSIDDAIVISQKSTRQSFLEAKFHDRVVTIEMSEIMKSAPISLESKINGYEYVIIMDRDIDLAGTYVTEMSPGLFRELVVKLADAVDKLHKARLRTVIISTDHGFLLIPKDYSVSLIEGLKSEDDFDKKRRYVIGKPPHNPSLVTFKMDKVFLKGEGEVAFPRGLSCLSMPGHVATFLHGGLSPQENCISVIVSKAKIETGKIKVDAELPDEITTAIFLVNLIPKATPQSARPRTVKVEAYSGDRKIAESDSIEMMNETKKARLVLKEMPFEAEVRVVDMETSEILKSRKARISIAGYAEEI